MATADLAQNRAEYVRSGPSPRGITYICMYYYSSPSPSGTEHRTMASDDGIERWLYICLPVSCSRLGHVLFLGVYT
ncbi:uncharacterized protein SETTUDRAFT_164708 [Exserohilum turcica Et28A]|uniref:Uncharacterized protein n=1 Tax=Exserohilum turcicum (strain 28A) TaxID=671987 RepID=R0ID45_EXST2|nr:uncharacterized protein SETTUDRAFT_164708 [Exserohilum turcica Et28A]EOA83285.1 hypothetical protein SETTUDRAFT_164708 [Exserohilum turcica Et28A]